MLNDCVLYARINPLHTYQRLLDVMKKSHSLYPPKEIYTQ